MYDTLCDIPRIGAHDPDALQILHELMIKPLAKEVVGVVIAGQAALPSSGTHKWGRGVRLETGEWLQVRLCPRGCAGKPLVPGETRLLATRRSAHGMSPEVAVAILFLPLPYVEHAVNVPLSTARTIGCRGVHLLLPSLFNKHSMQKPEATPHLDSEGFQSIRSTIMQITRTSPAKGGCGEVTLSVAPGCGYLVAAAQMCGVDVADAGGGGVRRIGAEEHARETALLHRRIVQRVGEAATMAHVGAGLTITDLLSADGVLSMLSNELFDGATPDTVHSPIGIPLVIVSACRIAAFPSRFKLPACTSQDAYASAEFSALFAARWDSVAENGCTAIDAMIKAGHENATALENNDPIIAKSIRDSLLFWQQVGQRILTSLVADPSVNGERQAARSARYGRSELVDDVLTDVKYRLLAQVGCATPLVEIPINRISLASRGDMRTALMKAFDSVECWLRTGFYGEVRLSKPNKKEDAVCLDALEAGASAVTNLLLYGAFAVHTFAQSCFLVGEHCVNTCADCDAIVSPLDGVLLVSNASECLNCSRRRCYACSSVALAAATAAPSPQTRKGKHKRANRQQSSGARAPEARGS
jgi:hypothetical protein